MTIIRLNAGNDANGNPRRVFVLLENNTITKVWDEGYQGSQAVPQEYQHILRENGYDTFDTTPKQYRDLLKRFR